MPLHFTVSEFRFNFNDIAESGKAELGVYNCCESMWKIACDIAINPIDTITCHRITGVQVGTRDENNLFASKRFDFVLRPKIGNWNPTIMSRVRQFHNKRIQPGEVHQPPLNHSKMIYSNFWGILYFWCSLGIGADAASDCSKYSSLFEGRLRSRPKTLFQHVMISAWQLPLCLFWHLNARSSSSTLSSHAY